MVEKQIVCLANSRMEGDRCIAGKDISSGNWIRPVNKPGAGLSRDDREYKDGSDPKLLDVIEGSFVIPYPHFHHSENWLLASDARLTCKRRFDWSDLANLADDPKDLWGTDLDIDRVPLDRIRNCSSSLYLIRAQDMVLDVKEKNNGEKQVRGKFIYHKTIYTLGVTDPKIEASYKEKPKGKYSLGECYVTVSLAENPFRKSYYKLIAAIILPNKRTGE
ncbi:MAG: hypothetical protein OXB94_13740 [Nitrospira sp.]|nr:hypothetical protein [Nitrospira sp.]